MPIVKIPSNLRDGHSLFFTVSLINHTACKMSQFVTIRVQ